jgi:hypothetical protein
MFIMLKVTNVKAPAIVRISDYSSFMVTDKSSATKDQKKNLFILGNLFFYQYRRN